MGTKRRKSYTQEYRPEAAHLVIDTGRTIAAVAAEINGVRNCWAVGSTLSVTGSAPHRRPARMSRSGPGRKLPYLVVARVSPSMVLAKIDNR